MRIRTHGQQLDQGRLSSSVGSQDTDTTAQRQRTRYIDQAGLGSAFVGESTVGELHDGSGLRPHTHERSGRGEGEPAKEGTVIVVSETS